MKDFKTYLAPMLDVTTPQFRTLIRLASPSSVLFTEMIVDETILNISENELLESLGTNPNDIVQLGGSNPLKLAKAINIIKKYGFKEFNLNCGCPSDRVKSGNFGAVLMLNPDLICEILKKVTEECNVKMSLKIRLGVEDKNIKINCDDYDFIYNFVNKTSLYCDTYFVHARKCILSGISPKDNRTIPPLNYDFVYRLKRDFPNLKIILNGGVNISNVKNEEFKELDGVMIGRAVMINPFLLNSNLNNEKYFCDEDYKKNVWEILRKYFEYYKEIETVNHGLINPLMNLLNGRKYCKRFKDLLSTLIREKTSTKELILKIERYFINEN